MMAGYLVGGLNPPTIIAAGIASLIPDIDHYNSKIGSTMPVMPRIINLIVGHRTLFHSLLGALIVSFIAFLIGGISLAIPVAAGYLAHLAGDTLTNSGVPLLWPLPYRFRIPIFNTGGLGERLLVFPAAVALFVWLIVPDTFIKTIETLRAFWVKI